MALIRTIVCFLPIVSTFFSTCVQPAPTTSTANDQFKISPATFVRGTTFIGKKENDCETLSYTTDTTYWRVELLNIPSGNDTGRCLILYKNHFNCKDSPNEVIVKLDSKTNPIQNVLVGEDMDQIKMYYCTESCNNCAKLTTTRTTTPQPNYELENSSV